MVVVALLVVFGSGIVVGMNLSDRPASASTMSARPLTEDQLKAGGGICPMMSDDPAKAQPAAAMSESMSGGCPMNKLGASKPAAAGPAAKASPKTPATTYICTMCPEVHASKPGDCPKCGMALVKKVR